VTDYKHNVIRAGEIMARKLGAEDREQILGNTPL
jgi:hypothetical protein